MTQRSLGRGKREKEEKNRSGEGRREKKQRGGRGRAEEEGREMEEGEAEGRGGRETKTDATVFGKWGEVRIERDELILDERRRAMTGPVLRVSEVMNSKGIPPKEPRFTNGALKIPFVLI